MTQASPHHMSNSKVVLYKIPSSRTPNWYFRVKLKNASKWKKFTAKTADLDELRNAALRKYEMIRELETANYPVDSKRFDHIADLTIEKLEEELNAGTGKPTYVD